MKNKNKFYLYNSMKHYISNIMINNLIKYIENNTQHNKIKKKQEYQKKDKRILDIIDNSLI